MMLFCCYIGISEQHVSRPPWSIVFVWIYTCIYAYAMYGCNIFNFTRGYISIHPHLFNQSTRFLDRLLQMIYILGSPFSLFVQALFSSKKFSQKVLQQSSHRILRYVHGALNVDEKKLMHGLVGNREMNVLNLISRTQIVK